MDISNACIICSEKVSDGLMMMVASHRLICEGANVTTFHDRLHELNGWFGDHLFSLRPSLDDLETTLLPFDFVILQYDSSPYMRELTRRLNENKKSRLAIFYPFYSKYTHPPLSPLDRIFNKHLPMVDNISFAISSILQLKDHSKNNGLLAPTHLLHRKYKRRVAILPSATIRKKYEKIAIELQKYGFDPLLLESEDLALGASLIYESGYFIGPESDLCHLSSNLQIPTLVVSGNRKPLMLVKPGWLRSSFITPPRWIPRARERFIFTSKVLSAFKKLVAQDKVFL